MRELENVVERAAILARGLAPRGDGVIRRAGRAGARRRVAVRRLPAPVAGTLEDVERRHIQRVLEQSRWVIEGERGAAHVLGLNASTLRGRMRKLGIRKPR